MNLNYRTAANAEAISAHWKKPLDRADWFEIKAQSDEATEILIYDVIGWPFSDAMELVRTLSAMGGKDMLVRINSPGGDVYDGMAIFNALQTYPGKVTTRIEGLAASMAGIIALAGKNVQAYKNAMLMIHEPWSIVAGSQFELREAADVLGKISSNMADVYAGASNVGKREIKEMMKNETWFNAEEAKNKGFIDTIIDGKSSAKAQFDLSMFANVPDCLSGQSNEEPAIRKYERALRDAGASKSEARSILARGWKTKGAEDNTEVLEQAEKVLKIMKGGK
jgi:ATP-dependent Clp endopeptidase proteolytic subunit ClpP